MKQNLGMRYFLICFHLQYQRSRAQLSGHMVYKNEFLDINDVIEKARCRDNDIIIITSVFELTEQEYNVYLSKLPEKVETDYT